MGWFWWHQLSRLVWDANFEVPGEVTLHAFVVYFLLPWMKGSLSSCLSQETAVTSYDATASESLERGSWWLIPDAGGNTWLPSQARPFSNSLQTLLSRHTGRLSLTCSWGHLESGPYHSLFPELCCTALENGADCTSPKKWHLGENKGCLTHVCRSRRDPPLHHGSQRWFLQDQSSSGRTGWCQQNSSGKDMNQKMYFIF